MKKQLFIVLISILLTISMAGCVASPEQQTEPQPADPTDETDAKNTDYDGGLFDPSKVHTIDISLSDEDWQDLLKQPQEKTKYRSDVTIDGELIENVACSTKGNSSLLMVKELYGIDRYSLKITFGKFEKEQKFHGLRKLNLNNSFSDSTYMKDYLCYTMFRKAGVAAPLCSFAWVRVNGADYGLFLAVEEVDESFLERNGWQNSVLYKPDSDKLAADSEELDRVIQNAVQVEDYGEGAELGYRGESIEDYPDIFNNAETDADDEDMYRVIRALKGLSEGRDLDDFLYTDELIRYFAVQNFVLNHDGYTGSMLHNYYLCEKQGRLAMFPWDYNASFASAWARSNPAQSDATMLANYGIDTPLLGATPEQRPMWKWVVDDDSYKEKYHQAMDVLLATYIESGEFEKETEDLVEMLLPYVQKDPTALYGAERFVSASQSLRTFCLLRAESVRRQLDGRLSTENQNQLPEDQVDVSMMAIADLS